MAKRKLSQRQKGVKGYLKYVIENCKYAFDELHRINTELLEGMGLDSNADVNRLGALNRMIQDYLIVRVAGLFDRDIHTASFENVFKGTKDYEAIKQENIIKYIIDLRHNFVGHFNIRRILQGQFPETSKILNSNLKELLEKLKRIVS